MAVKVCDWILNAADTIFMNADIDVSGTGFKEGNGFNSQQPILNCDKNDYYYPQSNIDIAGQKGESMAVLSEAETMEKEVLQMEVAEDLDIIAVVAEDQMQAQEVLEIPA